MSNFLARWYPLRSLVLYFVYRLSKWHYRQRKIILCAGTTPILEKTLREWSGKWKSFGWVRGNSGIAPRVAPRIVGFVLIKLWEAIPRMGFRVPRMEFRIPRAAPRIPRNSPRAPRRAFPLRERFSWNRGGSQASEIIFKLIMHFIADTDTDKNYFGINFS